MIRTGNKNFWIAQSIGWSIFALSNFAVQYFAGFSTHLLLVNSLLPLVCGFLITTIFRYSIKKYSWKKLSFLKLLGLMFASSLVQSFVLVTFMLLLTKTLFGMKEPYGIAFLNNFIVFGILLLTWNFIYFFIHFYNNWHRAEIEKWQLLSEMKDAQLGALKSQINPHFVFNAINNIRSLILEDKEKARDMLLNFSDLFRYSLQHANNEKVLLQEEITIVEQYLELLSIQFEEKLTYNIQVEPELLDQKIPPMMIQMLVENAIKHGISQQVNGGVIDIGVFKKATYFIIEVKNTGGLKQKVTLGERIGVGIQNIKERLHLLYEEKATFKISEKQNLVTASIKIPLQ